jgi:hypothetical protein
MKKTDNKKARCFARNILGMMMLAALLFGSIANASLRVVEMCDQMSHGVEAEMMHDSMLQATEKADCCQSDTMPDCSSSCNTGVFNFSNIQAFPIDTHVFITAIGVTQKLRSISSPPLLRPPLIA